jgi:hypothetical protein
MVDIIEEKQIVEAVLDLSCFSNGSDNFYAYNFGRTRIGIYTDGVKHIADVCGAYWLIDLIMSYQTPKFKAKNEFQVWILKSNGKGGAIAVCEDGDGNKVITQKIGFSDFPFKKVENGEMKMWFTGGTLLLPCEY